MTKGDEVLAIIVSYNGAGRIRETVEALRGQVGHIHIVDNGSEAESLAVLDSLERQGGVSVVRLGENRGVGDALNLGVRRARELGYPWLLTMDQDTVVDGSFIKAYQNALDQDTRRVCLTARISNGTKRSVESGVTGYAITSGNLVRVSVFDEIGLYDEGFFIDCIDFDFCLRLRSAGYSVYRVKDAVMSHQLGEASVLPGFLKKFYTRHHPIRRYYMTRNFMYMAERHLRKFPLFIIKLGILQALLTVLVGFFDAEPLRSYRAMADGIGDYFARKRGKWEGQTS
jgi:rhamnosyltransferase